MNSSARGLDENLGTSRPDIENHHSDKVSEPYTSDSNSIYSHVRSNYLETNESQAIDVNFNKEAYHMKPEQINSPPLDHWIEAN